jgi:hypothetical protein
MSSRLFGITVAHCESEVLEHGLTKFVATSGVDPEKYYVVDHHWPINHDLTSMKVRLIAKTIISATIVVSPEKNLGGHGGFTYGVEQMNKAHNLQDEDLIIGYDPDSNPLTPNWLVAMVKAMTDSPQLTSISLMHEHIVERPWKLTEVNGIKLATLPHPEMFNATIWRYKALKEGLKGQGFYGHVEAAMFKPGTHAYLYDYRETVCPIHHPQIYNDWKSAHAFNGYAGNFDEYVKDKAPKAI